MSKNRSASSVILLLTSQALADLREIEEYSLQQWGRKITDRYLDDLECAFDRLNEQPELLWAEPGISAHLSFYRVRKHLLVCDSSEHALCVLTIIHTSMNVPARLAELVPRLELEVEFLHKKIKK